MDVDSISECGDLLYKFMSVSLPELWRTKPDQVLLIQDWCRDETTVAPFDRFARWEITMSQGFAPIMQETYTTLGFDRAQQAHVVSPRNTDWTFLVYVIRYEFLKLPLAAGTKQPIREHALSMQLLDEIERVIMTQDRHRTPSPNAVPRKDTPEPEKKENHRTWVKNLVARLPESSIDLMLARLNDFIE